MGLGVCNEGARFIVWLLEGGEEWMRVLGQQKARTEVGTETEFTSLVLKEWAEFAVHWRSLNTASSSP